MGSLRTRVSVLAGVGAIVLAVLAVLLAVAYQQARVAEREILNRFDPAADLSVALILGYDEADRSVRDYVVTGDTVALRSHTTTIGVTQKTQMQLRLLVQSDEGLSQHLDEVGTAAGAWTDTYANPAVAERGQGNSATAIAIEYGDGATAAYSTLRVSTVTLQRAIDTGRDAQIDVLREANRRFAVALATAGLLLLAGLVAAYGLVRTWVLTPLDHLRRQLRAVARYGRREEVITPSGLYEFAAAGQDAESMRRAVLALADKAEASVQALSQQGPVVAALRRELHSTATPTPGLSVCGELHPAEGVLAGDWWDVVVLADGRTALLMLDVSGHGALAGLAALRAKTVIIVALRAGFDPGTALSRAGSSFADAKDGRFATGVVVVVDPRANSLTWANAGHPPPWLMPGGSPIGRKALTATGPLLSALGGEWVTRTCAFGIDVVLAWSDGLTETRAAEQELSDDDLAALVVACQTTDPQELVARLASAVRADSSEWHRDDVTVVALAREQR